MTPEQIKHVQDSFKMVVPISNLAAEIFYGRLFKIAPHVQPYFQGNMQEQGQKLMTTLGVVVNGLRDLEKIVPAAEELAVRHVGYGVKAEDYAPVGEALVYALEAGLEDAFTPEVKDSWITAYGTLSSVMIQAAYPKAAQ